MAVGERWSLDRATAKRFLHEQGLRVKRFDGDPTATLVTGGAAPVVEFRIPIAWFEAFDMPEGLRPSDSEGLWEGRVTLPPQGPATVRSKLHLTMEGAVHTGTPASRSHGFTLRRLHRGEQQVAMMSPTAAGLALRRDEPSDPTGFQVARSTDPTVIDIAWDRAPIDEHVDGWELVRSPPWPSGTTRIVRLGDGRADREQVDPGVTYSYALRAFDDSSCGTPLVSDWVRASTGPAAIIPSIAPASGVEVAPGTVRLDWQPAATVSRCGSSGTTALASRPSLACTPTPRRSPRSPRSGSPASTRTRSASGPRRRSPFEPSPG